MTSPRSRPAWTYESIVSAVPGLQVRPLVAVALQFLGFELAVVGLALAYGLSGAAVLAGTVAVGVAAAGSAAMLFVGRTLRRPAVPARYRRLVLDTGVDVVLGLVAYASLLTYLFALEPAGGTDVLARLATGALPVPVTFLALIVLWDVCYRIGTAWWAALCALWRSARLPIDPGVAGSLRRADLVTMAFGLLQGALLAVVGGHPLLQLAVAGHVAAVVVVTTLAVALLGRKT